ncbi:MAG: hypothetical protein NVS2B16_19500 [Chloroflexota bacterium]
MATWLDRQVKAPEGAYSVVALADAVRDHDGDSLRENVQSEVAGMRGGSGMRPPTLGAEGGCCARSGGTRGNLYRRASVHDLPSRGTCRTLNLPVWPRFRYTFQDGQRRGVLSCPTRIKGLEETVPHPYRSG